MVPPARSRLGLPTAAVIIKTIPRQQAARSFSLSLLPDWQSKPSPSTNAISLQQSGNFSNKSKSQSCASERMHKPSEWLLRCPHHRYTIWVQSQEHKRQIHIEGHSTRQLAVKVRQRLSLVSPSWKGSERNNNQIQNLRPCIHKWGALQDTGEVSQGWGLRDRQLSWF